TLYAFVLPRGRSRLRLRRPQELSCQGFRRSAGSHARLPRAPPIRLKDSAVQTSPGPWNCTHARLPSTDSKRNLFLTFRRRFWPERTTAAILSPFEWRISSSTTANLPPPHV